MYIEDNTAQRGALQKALNAFAVNQLSPLSGVGRKKLIGAIHGEAPLTKKETTRVAAALAALASDLRSRGSASPEAKPYRPIDQNMRDLIKIKQKLSRKLAAMTPEEREKDTERVMAWAQKYLTKPLVREERPPKPEKTEAPPKPKKPKRPKTAKAPPGGSRS
jgi:hypothetical protein